MFGATALKFSTTCHSHQSLITRFSASTVVSLHPSVHSMRSAWSIGSKRCLMMARCATWCGVIQMTFQDGWSVLVVQATCSEERSSRNGTERIALTWSAEPISWSWKATNRCLTTPLSPFGQHLTIATDAATSLRFSNSMKTSLNSTKYLNKNVAFLDVLSIVLWRLLSWQSYGCRFW